MTTKQDAEGLASWLEHRMNVMLQDKQSATMLRSQAAEIERLNAKAADLFGKWEETCERENKQREELERLHRYDTLLTAQMPADYKDWHQNSKEEWPLVAALSLKSLLESRDWYASEVDKLQAELEALRADTARYRYAMDWGVTNFAVCMRVGNTGVCWEPVKTDGPIDAAMKGETP